MKRCLPAILIAALASAAALAAGAEAAAEKSARGWLAVVDAGQYGRSWDEAAAFFRKALTRAQWEEALRKARTPLGKAVSRKLREATATTSLPGAPAGEYVVIQFDTDFENRRAMTETITPMKDSDGTWRVSGYYIK
jgi:opacity protein-like surface antigen